MSERLKKIFADNDWKADPNKPQVRASYYRALLKTQLGFSEQVTVRQELANELLRAGDSDAAIHELEGLRAYIQQNPAKLSAEKDRQLREALAISYLRLGEQENCLHFHGQKSCLFPLQASAVHKLPRGAQGAVRELSALLEQHPDDLESRWLLNVAYMQLGEISARRSAEMVGGIEAVRL